VRLANSPSTWHRAGQVKRASCSMMARSSARASAGVMPCRDMELPRKLSQRHQHLSQRAKQKHAVKTKRLQSRDQSNEAATYKERGALPGCFCSPTCLGSLSRPRHRPLGASPGLRSPSLPRQRRQGIAVFHLPVVPILPEATIVRGNRSIDR
jgi:hypothetical protein